VFTNVHRTASAVSEVRPSPSCMEFEVRPASEVERFVAFARANGCQCRLLFSGRPHRLTFDVPLARDPTEARRIALDVIASFSAENTRGRRGIGSSSPLGSRRSGTSRVGRPPPRRHRYATFRPSPRSRTTSTTVRCRTALETCPAGSLQFHCRGQGVESPLVHSIAGRPERAASLPRRALSPRPRRRCSTPLPSVMPSAPE
jgi:hypothetical protein